MNLKKIESPWVLLNISGVIYAISCESVISLNQLGKITPIPKAPKEVRGMIDFRGSIIQLLDIKKILNLKSTEEEINDFDALMDARLNDHVNWVKALEDSVINNTEFTLATDPHKCAFGKWYDSYNLKSTNIMFISTFSKFDKPHKAIHEIAGKAKKFVDNNNISSALSLIESTKDNELKQMIHLFEDLKMAYKDSKKEIVVVIGDEKNNISIAVDEIAAIEHISEVDQDLIKNTMTNTEYLAGVGKRKDSSAVFLLNDDYLIEKFANTVCK